MCGEEHGEENFSMKKRITALLGVLLLFALTPCAAWAEELLVGGQAVGIEISAEGVIVSGLTFLLYKRISPLLHKGDDRKKKRREGKTA